MVPVEPRVRRDEGGPLPAAVHRRPADHHHDRPPSAAGRAERRAIGALLSGRSVGRDDRDRSTDRLRQGDGGWQGRRLLGRELRRRPREPGDRRQHGTPGRLVVQAVRAGRGAGERHLAEHGVPGAVLDRDPAGQRDGVGRLERRAEQLRQPDAGAGHDLVREHGVRAADQPARRPDRGGRRQADGHPLLPARVGAEAPAAALPLGGARARTRSTRSR